MEQGNQDLVFKTSEDHRAAIDALGDVEDAPAGVTMDAEYLAKYDARLQALMDAKIDPEYVAPTPEEEAAATAAAAAVAAGTKTPEEIAAETAATEAAAAAATDPIEAATAPLRAQIDEMRRQTSSALSEWEVKKKEMEDKIEALRTATPAAPAAPVEPATPNAVDVEIDQVHKEIEDLEKEMNGIGEDDYENKADLAAKQARKATRLSILTRKSQVEMAKLHSEEMAKVKAENQKREDDAKRKLEIKEKEHKKEANEAARITATESFRKSRPEFSGKKPYKQMETEHANFAYDVASRYWNRRPDQIEPAEAEVAMAAYLDNSPALMAKVADLKEPADMRKYILLTEIEMAQMGLELDKYNGKWNQRTDAMGRKVVLPDMDTAYDYIQKKNGITAAQITEMQKTTAQNVKAALDRRTNPGEIEAAHVAEGLGNDMTKEEAIKIMQDHDEEKLQIMATQALKAGKPMPREVEFTNRALAVLKLDPIVG